MKTKSLFMLSISALFLFTSCAHRLVGTWSVENYERKTPGQPGMSVNNIGSITFDKDGSGVKNLDYSLLGVSKKDNTPFSWSATEEFVTIDGQESELTKTWIYIENKKKYQKWQSTDGANNVQTIKLAKK